MMLQTCLWMKASQEKIHCERPYAIKGKKRNDRLCSADLLHPEKCPNYKQNPKIIIKGTN